MMTKEQIFEEFKIAKEKDIAKSTTNHYTKTCLQMNSIY